MLLGCTTNAIWTEFDHLIFSNVGKPNKVIIEKQERADLAVTPDKGRDDMQHSNIPPLPGLVALKIDDNATSFSGFHG